MMQLRPYQTEAVNKIVERWGEWRKELLVLPTGCGKTVVFNTVAHERPGNVLILAGDAPFMDSKTIRPTGTN